MSAEPTFATADDLLASLPSERRADMTAVRQVLLECISSGVVETISGGLIAYSVPHDLYPAGYHCNPRQPLPFAALASNKGGMSLHLFCIYVNPELVRRFRAGYAASGKRMDMGAACVRFRRLSDLPLDVVREAISALNVEEYIAQYERVRPAGKKAKP